jgi:NADH-quinone oxidoreductase subunit L
MIASVIILSAVILAAYNRYVKKAAVPPMLEQDMSQGGRLAYHKFYVDELYNKLIVRPSYAIADVFYKIIDTKLIDGIVNSVSKTVTGVSGYVRLIQSGYVGFYIFAMVFGIIAILVLNLIR